MAKKEKALAVKEAAPKPMTMEDVLAEGRAYIKSGILPAHIKNEYQYAVIRQKGWELGIKPLAACSMIYIISGVPTVSPKLMLALANRTGELEDIVITRDPAKQAVTVMVRRKGRSPYSETFGAKEAVEQLLAHKDNYKKQPMRMYTWRALSLNLNVTFPDALMGMLTPEELDAEVIFSEDDDLDMKGVKVVHLNPEQDKQAVAAGMVTEILSGLTAIFGGADTLEAQRAYLADLTRWTDETGEHFIELADLGQLKPAWIERIYAKVMPEIKKTLEDKNKEVEL